MAKRCRDALNPVSPQILSHAQKTEFLMLKTNQHGPDPVLIWGRGHVCVFPQDAENARWLPERLVRFAAPPDTRRDDPNLDLAEPGDDS